MHKFYFKPDDLFINRLKTYPEYNVFIYQGQMFVNRESRLSGSGGIDVYDINRSRTSNLIYPMVETGSVKNLFKSQVYQPLLKNFSSDYAFIGEYWSRISGSDKVLSYGDGSINGEYTSSYGYESPIKRNLTSRISQYSSNYFNLNTGQLTTGFFTSPLNYNQTASALQNVARKYTVLSDHFIFASSSIRSRDLVTGSAPINFITIPSMYYGSSIKKGSVELNYYITGSKIATCADKFHNGVLVETTGSNVDAVVGLVMYDEGIIMLTASHDLESNDIEYVPSTATSGSWLYYGTTLNDGTGSSNTLASASYDLNFNGVNYVNSMTMFAHARKGHLNHSNNPTYKGNTMIGSVVTGSGLVFAESSNNINNIVSGSFVSASFDKTTYISKVHIYDEDGNLIAITSMAKPIKKTLQDEFTFKMKLDL
jgi:hypothetical protein